jgi:hypothetical protein
MAGLIEDIVDRNLFQPQSIKQHQHKQGPRAISSGLAVNTQRSKSARSRRPQSAAFSRRGGEGISTSPYALARTLNPAQATAQMGSRASNETLLNARFDPASGMEAKRKHTHSLQVKHLQDTIAMLRATVMDLQDSFAEKEMAHQRTRKLMEQRLLRFITQASDLKLREETVSMEKNASTNLVKDYTGQIDDLRGTVNDKVSEITHLQRENDQLNAEAVTLRRKLERVTGEHDVDELLTQLQETRVALQAQESQNLALAAELNRAVQEHMPCEEKTRHFHQELRSVDVVKEELVEAVGYNGMLKRDLKRAEEHKRILESELRKHLDCERTADLLTRTTEELSVSKEANFGLQKDVRTLQGLLEGSKRPLASVPNHTEHSRISL